MSDMPKQSGKRVALNKSVEAGVSAIPLAGGPLAVVLAWGLTASFEKRREEWLERLAEDVEELKRCGVGPGVEGLADDPRFVDVVVQASVLAQQTSDATKLEALRNGVLNSLAVNASAADEHARFLRLIGEMTPAHLRMLGILHDPRAAIASAEDAQWNVAGSLGQLLTRIEPQFDDGEWADLIHGDLARAGLINSGGLRTMMTPDGMLQSRSTSLGQRFLRFIEPPLERKAGEVAE